MLTVQDALELSIFEKATVVAGTAGLGNVIRWVHIVTMPDSSWYEWIKGSELILTVGFGMRTNEEKQRQLIPTLIKHNIAGLVLSVGHYFEETPQIIIEQANRFDFPIIELPGNVPFVEVTEAIFTQLVNEQYAIVQRAQSIHKALMNVVLNGGTIQDVAEALATYSDRSITIESSSFQVLASAEEGDIDRARRRTLETGETNINVIEYLHENGLHDQLTKNKMPIKIPPQPEIGLDIERIVAPIMVAKSLLGYMWIIADEGTLTELDRLAVEQAAMVAALLFYKEKAVQESRRAMRGDFFAQLLQADQYSRSQLESQAKIFDFRLNINYQVLVIENHYLADDLSNRIELLLQKDTPALVITHEQRVVIVLQARQTPQGKRIAQMLLAALSEEKNYRIGVGTVVTHHNQIATSYEQAREALTIANSVHQRTGVYLFDELGMLHWMLQIPEEALQDNVFYRVVCELNAQDTQLFETLEAFLDFGGSMKDAADKLYVHRNTLTYRLGRIEEITRFDLRDSRNQMNLYIALKAYRLRNTS